jgi:hypothetical protein
MTRGISCRKVLAPLRGARILPLFPVVYDHRLLSASPFGLANLPYRTTPATGLDALA